MHIKSLENELEESVEMIRQLEKKIEEVYILIKKL